MNLVQENWIIEHETWSIFLFFPQISHNWVIEQKFYFLTKEPTTMIVVQPDSSSQNDPLQPNFSSFRKTPKKSIHCLHFLLAVASTSPILQLYSPTADCISICNEDKLRY